MNEHYGPGIPALRVVAIVGERDRWSTGEFMHYALAAYRGPIRDLFESDRSILGFIEELEEQAREEGTWEACGRGGACR